MCQVIGTLVTMTPSNGNGRDWTFLSNHGHVLICINRTPDLRVRDIAVVVGITERSALAILADLETAGYITVDRIGRRNTYKVNDELRFRHPSEASQPISQLLRIFTD
jgi:predicted ArsR family transcriptional regulator